MTHLSWLSWAVFPCIAIVRAHLNFDRERWRDMVEWEGFFYSVEVKHKISTASRDLWLVNSFSDPKETTQNMSFMKHGFLRVSSLQLSSSRLSISRPKASAASQGGLHFQAQLPAQKKAHKRNMTWCILGGANGRERIGAGDTKKPL